jgi:hypothetical protein
MRQHGKPRLSRSVVAPTFGAEVMSENISLGQVERIGMLISNVFLSGEGEIYIKYVSEPALLL